LIAPREAWARFPRARRRKARLSVLIRGRTFIGMPLTSGRAGCAAVFPMASGLKSWGKGLQTLGGRVRAAGSFRATRYGHAGETPSKDAVVGRAGVRGATRATNDGWNDSGDKLNLRSRKGTDDPEGRGAADKIDRDRGYSARKGDKARPATEKGSDEFPHC